jgi:hypothetical protein
MSDSAPPTQPDYPVRKDGHCYQCGYSLIGLPQVGRCPECGVEYDQVSAKRLQPWPSALQVCALLGWPIVLILIAMNLVSHGRSPLTGIGLLMLGLGIVGLPINSWISVHILLKRSMPENVRTRGGVAIMRRLGIALCVFALLILVLPVIAAIGCLVMMSNTKF